MYGFQGIQHPFIRGLNTQAIKHSFEEKYHNEKIKYISIIN
jgi:hypothetical protein